MDFRTLAAKNRSIRRFRQSERIAPETLRELIDLARLTPSGRNCQYLRYKPVAEAAEVDLINSFLSWAGYLPDWHTQEEGEKPAAMIVLLRDREAGAGSPLDVGIAAQTILLGAVERGLGGCMLGNIRRQELHEALKLPGYCDVELVVALGVPAETVVIEPPSPGGDLRYYRTADGVHHVPKLALDDIIL